MAYPNNYYPQFYPQNPQLQTMQPPVMPTVQIPTPQMATQQIEPLSGGLVNVRNETEARNYPVGYGKSVTFKDETAPYVYTKTMGFSQLEQPRFEKYRLVREDAETPNNAVENAKTENLPTYAEKAEIEDVRAEIKALKDDIAKLKSIKKKREVILDDDE